MEIEWVNQMGGQCPVQAMGYVDGMAFYFRARGGVSLDIWTDGSRLPISRLGYASLPKSDEYTSFGPGIGGMECPDFGGYPGWWTAEQCTEALMALLPQALEFLAVSEEMDGHLGLASK